MTVCEASPPGSGALSRNLGAVGRSASGVGSATLASRDDERLVPAVSLAGDDGLDWDDAADWPT